jgi:hypothetical protein
VLDDDDKAPEKVAEHFKSILLRMRNHEWNHFTSQKLKGLKAFHPKSIRTFRSFDSHPSPFWLGPTLLSRAVTSFFHSLRHLYHIYKTPRITALVQQHFHVYWRGVSTLPASLLTKFPELAPRKASGGRKRKLTSVVGDQKTGKEIKDVSLQGSTSRVVAVLCRFDDDSKCASWCQLDALSDDFADWWSAQIESRYPLLHQNDFQVKLILHRDGTFARV